MTSADYAMLGAVDEPRGFNWVLLGALLASASVMAAFFWGLYRFVDWLVG